jgi:hypothetical protein
MSDLIVLHKPVSSPDATEGTGGPGEAPLPFGEFRTARPSRVWLAVLIAVLVALLLIKFAPVPSGLTLFQKIGRTR